MAKDYVAEMQGMFKKYDVNVKLLSDPKARVAEVVKMGEGFTKGEWTPNGLMMWSKEVIPATPLNAVSIKQWLKKAGFVDERVSPAPVVRHKASVSAPVAQTTFINALASGSEDNPAMLLLGEYLKVLPPDAVAMVIQTVESLLTPQQKLDAQRVAKHVVLQDYMELARMKVENMFNKFTTPVDVVNGAAKHAEGKPGELVPKAEPEAADATEAEPDFLARMKQVICDNQDMDNADYQRLLDLKAMGHSDAIELVEAFETSPEAEEAKPAKESISDFLDRVEQMILKEEQLAPEDMERLTTAKSNVRAKSLLEQIAEDKRGSVATPSKLQGVERTK